MFFQTVREKDKKQNDFAVSIFVFYLNQKVCGYCVKGFAKGRERLLMGAENIEGKRQKVRFNLVDVLITALLLFCLFVVVAFFFLSDSDESKVVSLQIPENAVNAFNAVRISAARGSIVTDEESGEILGYLYEEYQNGDNVLIIRCKNNQNGRLWRCGDKLSVSVGEMVVADGWIVDIRKEGEDGKA